jgi:hypothetical protein
VAMPHKNAEQLPESADWTIATCLKDVDLTNYRDKKTKICTNYSDKNQILHKLQKQKTKLAQITVTELKIHKYENHYQILYFLPCH